MRRMWAASAAMLVCLAVGLPALAQEESPSPVASGPNDVTEELLFEVTLPPGAMGERLERINSGGLIIAPGVEAVMGTDNEAIRGRFMFLESGQLVVTPMVDSPIWQAGTAQGGRASIAQAGEAARLEPGDLIFLPVLAIDDLVPGATIVVANPGTEPAETRGFHAHAYESFAGWPDGITENEGFAEANDAEDVAAAIAGDVVFRMTRFTVPVGASLPLDEAALFTLVDVHEGKVQRSVSGNGDEAPPFWNPIHGGYLPGPPDWTFDLVIGGNSPAVVDELAVLPTAQE